MESEIKQPKKKHRCYAHNHMNAKMWLVYTRAVTLSYNSGVFYFDGRKLAAEFEGVSKHTTYTGANQLKEKGWLVPLRPLKRLRNGLFASTSYRVLSHDEWAELHPGQCRTFDEKEEDASEEHNFDNKVGQPQADERSVSNMELTSPSIRTGDAQEGESPVPQSGLVVPKNGTHRSLDPDQQFSQSGLTSPPTRTDQSLDPDIVSRESKYGEREGSEGKGRGMGKGKGAASPPAPPSSQNPPARVASTKRMTEAELSKEFACSSPCWEKYNEFVSADPEGWNSLKNRRKKTGEDTIAWIRSLYFFSQPSERDKNWFIGSLLTLKATDDELTVRPDGSSLIQVAIEEAIGKGKSSLFEFWLYLDTKLPAIRATYNKKHNAQLLENVQPVGTI